MTYMYEPTGVSLLHSADEPSADARFREQYAHEHRSHAAAEPEPSPNSEDLHIIERMWARIGNFRTIA